MFGNDAKAVQRRLVYCSELSELAVLKERYPDQYKGNKPLFKLKRKQQILRSLLGGMAVPAVDKVMVSDSEARTHYAELMAQFEAETDAAKKSKMLLEMKNYMAVQWYAWRSEKNTRIFPLHYQQIALEGLLDQNKAQILEQINHLQQNSKIAGMFDRDKAKNLLEQSKQLLAEQDASRTQLFDDHIYPKNREIMAQKKALRVEYLALIEQESDDAKQSQLSKDLDAKISILSQEMAEFKEGLLSKLNGRYEQRKAEIEAQKTAMAQAVRDKVLSQSTVTQADAEKWLSEQVTITDQVRNKCKRNKISPEQFEQSIKDFFVMSNGRLGNIKIDTKNHDRAYADAIIVHDREGYIMMDNDFSLKTLWHELAHHLESDDCLRVLAQHYIRSRSLDGGEVHKLRDLTGNKNYAAKEKAYKTDMFSHYAAKIYQSGETELFSMGVEALYSTDSVFKAMSSDPKTLEFTTAALMQPKSGTDQLNKAMRDTLVDLDASAENQQANELDLIFKGLAQLVTWSSTSITMADLPPNDALFFKNKFDAAPYAELTFQNGMKWLLLQSSKVKVKGRNGRAMKGVFALRIEDYDDFARELSMDVFTKGGIYLDSVSTFAIQTLDKDKIKVMTLAMSDLGEVYGVKDTKGEIGEGYLSAANLKRLKAKFLGNPA